MLIGAEVPSQPMRLLLLVLIALSGWVGLNTLRVQQHADLARASAESQADVVLYVTSWCEECDEARDQLDARGITYVARDIETDEAAYDAYRARGGAGVVPLAVVRGEVLPDASPETVEAHLSATAP